MDILELDSAIPVCASIEAALQVVDGEGGSLDVGRELRDSWGSLTTGGSLELRRGVVNQWAPLSVTQDESSARGRPARSVGGLESCAPAQVRRG
jgi:hypothetical protein